MSDVQLKAFLARLAEDATLRDSLKDADLDAVLAVASGLGFELSRAQLSEHLAKRAAALSDAEVEQAAGGGQPSPQGGMTCPNTVCNCPSALCTAPNC